MTTETRKDLDLLALGLTISNENGQAGPFGNWQEAQQAMRGLNWTPPKSGGEVLLLDTTIYFSSPLSHPRR